MSVLDLFSQTYQVKSPLFKHVKKITEGQVYHSFEYSNGAVYELCCYFNGQGIFRDFGVPPKKFYQLDSNPLLHRDKNSENTAISSVLTQKLCMH